MERTDSRPTEAAPAHGAQDAGIRIERDHGGRRIAWRDSRQHRRT